MNARVLIEAKVCRSRINDVALHVHFYQGRSSNFVVLQAEWVQEKVLLILAHSNLEKIKWSMKKK